MLVLTRKQNEEIVIGNGIRILIKGWNNRGVTLGIEAPKHVSVHRGEVQERINREGTA